MAPDLAIAPLIGAADRPNLLQQPPPPVARMLHESSARTGHVFDMTGGWDGKPPSGIDHVVVVTHRPEPEGWDPEAPFHFVDGVEAAVAKEQELAGDRIVEVAAGDVGGQVLAAGLVDEVRMDVVPVVFGSGKRYFGSVDARHLLEDPDVVIQGNRVLHLRYRVRR